jgi:transcriptional regulator with XRE-family HTH domain
MLRMAAGVSGNELANAAGISRNTLHLIENKAANVQLDTLGRIATALDVDPCQFFVNDTLPSPSLHRIENLRAAVAANIHAARVHADITQEQLGQIVGLQKGYTSYIECNAPDLTLELIERIATALNTSVDKLLAD